MAKFKVGDIVEKDVPGDTWTGRVVSVTSGNKGVRAVTIKGDGSEGPTWAFDESEIRFANSAPLASANAVVQNAINARRARNAGGFDKAFVENKARSIYNDLDDLKDYLNRFAKDGVPAYMLSSVQDAMKAIGNI